MKVLVACEFSQIVTKSFRDKGHEAFSCDILPTEGNPDWHYKCDISKVIGNGWDLMIAHPPCTYLSNSGVRWLYEQEGRKGKMILGAKWFKTLLDCNIPKIAIENPIMHKYAVDIIGRRQDQIIHPWMFGENESKAVCLWLKNLPKLEAEVLIKPEKLEQRVWKMGPSPERQKERSRFFKGIADAMAAQWGNEK